MQVDRTAFTVHCGKCRFGWILFYMPISVEKLRRFNAKACPMCHERSVLVGAAGGLAVRLADYTFGKKMGKLVDVAYEKLVIRFTFSDLNNGN